MTSCGAGQDNGEGCP